MNRIIAHSLLHVTLLGLLLCLSRHPTQAQTTAFTYQGKLTDAGSPANGSYDLQFKLYDALSGGAQVGSLVTNAAVAASDGVFTVTLDFGANVFTGAARYLEIGVRAAGSANPYTVLAPRQPITSSPYAIQTLKAVSADGLSADCNGCVTGAKIATGQVVKSLNGLSDNVTLQAGSNVTLTPSGNTLTIASTGGGGGLSTVAHNPTLSGNGTSGVPLSVTVPLSLSGSSSSPLVSATNTGNGNGVVGSSNGGYGVVGDGGNGGYGVFATASGTDGYGVYATGSSRGVYGSSSTGTGVQGQSDSNTAVYGGSTSSNGVWGFSGSGTGVYGLANATTGTAPGVFGETKSGDPEGRGVYGQSGVGRGVQGNSTSGTGVYGYSGSGNAGYFLGNVAVTGNVSISATNQAQVAKLDVHNDSGSGLYARNGAGSGQNPAVYGQTDSSDPAAIGVFGLSTNNGRGVQGNSNGSGTGVFGYSGSGFAMQALGNTTQDRGSGGWVKAMALIDPFQPAGSQFVRCYNSQATGSTMSTPPCGFSIGFSATPGVYLIDFGFKVDDRFISITPFSAGGRIAANIFDFYSANQVNVEMGYTDVRGYSGDTHAPFYIIVY